MRQVSGVPGDLRGMEYLHAKHGVLPWREVLRPAIELARGGFRVGRDLVRYMDLASKDDFLTRDPAWAVDFAPNGTRVGLDDTMTRRRYADTLETIAEHGANAFYAGRIAEAMVRTLRRANGTMTLEDLAQYRIKSRRPVEIEYRGFKIVACGAPAGGSVVLSAMKTVEGYQDLGEKAAVNLSTHRLDEATRFAYGEVRHFPFNLKC